MSLASFGVVLPPKYTLSITDMLATYSEANRRSFAHDRTQSVGASDVGQCLRKSWFSKRGVGTYERDSDYEDSAGATDRGSVYENEIWAPALKLHKPGRSRLLYSGTNQETLKSGWLSATPDGLFVDLERDCLQNHPTGAVEDIESQRSPFLSGESDFGCVVVECKTIDPRANLKGKPKPNHVFQVQAQMGLIRERTKFLPNYAILTYTDASFFDRVTEFVIPFDPKIYRAAHVRAERIMTAIDASALPAEGKDSGSKDCEYCPYKRACAAVSMEAAPAEVRKGVALTPGQDAAFANAAFSATVHASNEKIAATRKKEAQAEVKAILKDADTRGYTSQGGIKAAWSWQAGKKSLDMDALLQAHPEIDLARFQVEGAPFDKLTITLPKPGTLPKS